MALILSFKDILSNRNGHKIKFYIILNVVKAWLTINHALNAIKW